MRISTLWEVLAVIQFPPQTAEIDKSSTHKSNATYNTKYSSSFQLRIDCQAISSTTESLLKYHGCMLSGKGLELSATDRFLKDEKRTSMRRKKSRKSTQICYTNTVYFCPTCRSQSLLLSLQSSGLPKPLDIPSPKLERTSTAVATLISSFAAQSLLSIALCSKEEESFS